MPLMQVVLLAQDRVAYNEALADFQWGVILAAGSMIFMGFYLYATAKLPRKLLQMVIALLLWIIGYAFIGYVWLAFEKF